MIEISFLLCRRERKKKEKKKKKQLGSEKESSICDYYLSCLPEWIGRKALVRVATVLYCILQVCESIVCYEAGSYKR